MVSLNQVRSCFVIRTCDGSALTPQFSLVNSYTHMIVWAKGMEFPSSKYNVVVLLRVLFPVIVSSPHLVQVWPFRL